MSANSILDAVAKKHDVPLDAGDKLDIACEYIDNQGDEPAFEAHVEIRAAQMIEEGSELPRDDQPAKQLMDVEVAVGMKDKRWFTAFVKISAYTPHEQIEEVAQTAYRASVFQGFLADVSFVSLYHYCEDALVEDPEELVWACPACKSTSVQSQMWITVNTDEPVNDTGGHYWCPACEDDGESGELNYNGGLLQIPRKESRESQEEHKEEVKAE